MVVVDTSIWIEFFRGKHLEIVRTLTRLLDEDRVLLAAPVRLELLSGSRKLELARLRRLLSALPLLVPDALIWAKLETWIERASRAGERFGAMDLLIAGIADEQ